MTSKDAEIAVAKAVASLRASNAAAWDAFMASLAARLEVLTEDMVSAPPDRLYEMQGRAREARTLFKQLVDAPKVANDLYERERNNAFTKPR